MSVAKDLRDNIIKKITAKLDSKIANEIEKGINNWTNKYVEENQVTFLADSIYQSKADEIINNLEEKHNKTLIKMIKSGQIEPATIAELKPEELNPDKFEKIIKKKEIEEIRKKNKTTSDVFKCPKCKARKSEVTEKQTRAGDEPMTTFVTCLECGHVVQF
jgi:transcription elongation factor S-II